MAPLKLTAGEIKRRRALRLKLRERVARQQSSVIGRQALIRRLRHLDRVERKAKANWNRSKRGGRVGDKRHLRIVLDCVKEEIALLGLAAADEPSPAAAPAAAPKSSTTDVPIAYRFLA